MLALLAIVTLGVLVSFAWRRSRRPLGDFLFLEAAQVYARLWHRCSVKRRAGLPTEGPAILVAKHVCSADPTFVLAGCERVVSFVLAREYWDLPLARHVFTYLGCVPVTRNGRDWVGLRTALQRLQEGRVVCIFPEGGLSGALRGKMGRGRAGIGFLALRSGAPVIPVHLEGGPRTRSIAQAWLWPSGGVRVTYGPALDLTAFTRRPRNRKNYEEVTRLIMARIAALSPRTELTMTNTTEVALTEKHCQPCEGGVPALTADQVQALLPKVPKWKLNADGKRLRREWRVKDFVTGLDFFQRIGKIAEAEDHHPDLHLAGYRNVSIELSTHAVGGLTENDFILAAKIDQLPVELKT